MNTIRQIKRTIIKMYSYKVPKKDEIDFAMKWLDQNINRWLTNHKKSYIGFGFTPSLRPDIEIAIFMFNNDINGADSHSKGNLYLCYMYHLK